MNEKILGILIAVLVATSAIPAISLTASGQNLPVGIAEKIETEEGVELPVPIPLPTPVNPVIVNILSLLLE